MSTNKKDKRQVSFTMRDDAFSALAKIASSMNMKKSAVVESLVLQEEQKMKTDRFWRFPMICLDTKENCGQ